MARLLILPILLLLPAFLQAQQDTARTDPKIGLVLSGGGAKCLAQIGALRAIEEAGVEVDYIGGTSMGAIIGAMYSLGYSVDQIEQYLRNVDWEALLANEIPRNRLSYFDRKNDSKYLLKFPITDDGVKLPRGINYGQYILKELSFITQKSYQYQDFSDFPIPFFCVATNLETGKLQVFEDGRLMDALRASSSFPSLFTPYEVEGQLYVDGGVVNNYPVLPLAQKGMDAIIGVDVQEFLYDRKELTNIVKVMEQTSSFLNGAQLKNQKKYTDVLIEPSIPEAGLTSFDMYDTIVKRGYEAAKKKMAQLKALAGQQDTVKKVMRGSAMPMKEFWIGDLQVRGNKNSTDRYIIGKLRIEEGEKCTTEELERGLDRLYGSQYFETVDYTLSPLDSGYRLNLNVKEREVLSQIKLGLNYNDDFKTGLLVNFTTRNLLFKNSRFSAEGVLSENPRLRVDYFVDRGFIPTLGFSFRSNRFNFKTYRQLEPVNERTYQDYSLDFFLQSTIQDAYALGGGVQIENAAIEQEFEIPGFSESDQGFINYYGFLDFDSFNDSYFPTKGFQLQAMYRIIAKRNGFSKFRPPSSVVNASYDQVFNFTNWLTLISRFAGASTIGQDLEAPYQIYLGSLGRDYINYIYPFAGYRYMELVGRNMLMARGDLQVEFFNNHYLLLRANVGKLEPTFDGLFASDILLDGYSLGYSFDSPVGPLEFNLTGSTNHDNIYSYISLGFWF